MKVLDLLWNVERPMRDLRQVLDNVPALIAYIDLQRRYAMVNQAYLAWSLRPGAEIVGRSVDEVHGVVGHALLSPHLDLAFSGTPVAFEADLQRGAELRAMHEQDLFPMRASLTGFLTAWMGGPRTWFEERNGACIMSIHKKLAIGPETANQWVDAMGRAARDTLNDPPFVNAMMEALGAMSNGMARNSKPAA